MTRDDRIASRVIQQRSVLTGSKAHVTVVDNMTREDRIPSRVMQQRSVLTGSKAHAI